MDFPVDSSPGGSALDAWFYFEARLPCLNFQRAVS
jgi:hypothetical protein